MRKDKLTLAIITATMTAGLSTANAASIEAGDWTLSFGGNINAFYNMTQCDGGDLAATSAAIAANPAAAPATLAGYACADAIDEKKAFTDTSSIQNGLLPASLNFGASTKQNGYDIGATVNVYYGTNSNTALGFSSVDARQVYMTFGKEKLGTFKIGRDFGIFGFDAIINDMTLLGVGGSFVAATPGHTTLGGLGYGYVYTDRLTQMNWTSPDMGGFQATLGLFQPLDGNGAKSGNNIGMHGKLSYGWKGGMPGKISASFLNQGANTTAGTSEDISGFDVFGNINFGNLGLSAYVFDGEGMSTLALGGLLMPGFDATTGAAEETSGNYIQATYKMGSTKLGVSFMSSEQEKVTKVENEKVTFGVYHNLTPSLTLVGELNQMESELTTTGTSDEASNISLGAILFF